MQNPRHSAGSAGTIRFPARVRPAPPGTHQTLASWRTTPPYLISSADVFALVRTLATTEILHDCRWKAARAGDASAAVAMALDRVRRETAPSVITDLILCSLVVLAKRGDPTAPLIIAHALKAFGRHDVGNVPFEALATSWRCWARKARTGRDIR